jgi:hypothetical protein
LPNLYWTTMQPFMSWCSFSRPARTFTANKWLKKKPSCPPIPRMRVFIRSIC